jgi:hypothetical protein
VLLLGIREQTEEESLIGSGDGHGSLPGKAQIAEPTIDVQGIETVFKKLDQRVRTSATALACTVGYLLDGSFNPDRSDCQEKK